MFNRARGHGRGRPPVPTEPFELNGWWVLPVDGWEGSTLWTRQCRDSPKIHLARAGCDIVHEGKGRSHQMVRTMCGQEMTDPRHGDAPEGGRECRTCWCPVKHG